MIPRIRKLKPYMVWWDGYKWVTNKWMVGTKENGFDCVPTFGRAFRFWLWHCGVPARIALGWFKKKKMRAVINGIEYEPVDTEIKEGMDVSCRECDIFKARIPKAMTQYPLCYEKGNAKIRESCYNKATKNIKRIWKKV